MRLGIECPLKIGLIHYKKEIGKMTLQRKFTDRARFLKNVRIYKNAGLLVETKESEGYYIMIVYPH